ncbi:hypothetical protein [Frateuria terrea]|uniref:Uncharacterized protein n=1 Tax=Frateuria terrea TaxID=529704 RepID=A0A1H6XT23_9GAMM|nr:hypothetical protein [Frateuria terrea]SEJ32203.1 hypothetical protein SAMN04487997_2990 [Frateuria terrea]SFP51637.1 hypothetical protein SAMN02927913_2451 [Frateuria terrea]
MGLLYILNCSYRFLEEIGRVMEKKIAVLDQNYRHKPELEEWLRAPACFVAVTDFSAMETYKSDELRSIVWAHKLLSKYADKVIVLKNTPQVLLLHGAEAGLRNRLINRESTRNFPGFCRSLEQLETNEYVRKQVLEHQRASQEHFEKMRLDRQNHSGIVRAIMMSFTKDERAQIRQGHPYSESVAKKIVKGIFELAAMAQLRMGARPCIKGKLYNYFVFRIAACHYLNLVRTIANGGNVPLDVDKTVNDDVDMTYVAYATYFDDLFTEEKKLRSLYKEVNSFFRLMKKVMK